MCMSFLGRFSTRTIVKPRLLLLPAVALLAFRKGWCCLLYIRMETLSAKRLRSFNKPPHKTVLAPPSGNKEDGGIE